MELEVIINGKPDLSLMPEEIVQAIVRDIIQFISKEDSGM